MRSFIAIELPEAFSAKLQSVQKQLMTDSAKLTLTKTFHLTLKFLGEIDDGRVDDLKSLLSKITFKPFDAKLTTIGFFPDENYIRVIHIGLEPEKQLKALQKTIEEALPNFKKDTSFHPHITLARVKFVKDKEQFKTTISKIKLPDFPEFKVENFKLIKSTLTSEGPVYEELASF